MDFTLFVLGAGSSAEAKIPAGDAFKADIRDRLDFQSPSAGRYGVGHQGMIGAQHLCEAIVHIAAQSGADQQKLPRLRAAAQSIVDAMPLAQSIDSFLESHQGNEAVGQVGRLAIAHAILVAESGSPFRAAQTPPGSSIPRTGYEFLEATWYVQFFKRLVHGRRWEDLRERFQAFKFVTFNYDRSLEKFLHDALLRYYMNKTSPDVVDLLRTLDIYHVYGWPGPLPAFGGNGAMEFGLVPSVAELVEASNRILTISRARSANRDSRVVEWVERAKQIVFLGFSFDDMNWDVLLGGTQRTEMRKDRRILATAFKRSDSDRKDLEVMLANGLRAGDERPIAANCTCAELFDQFDRSLRF
jgi:hypothetical protein